MFGANINLVKNTYCGPNSHWQKKQGAGLVAAVTPPPPPSPIGHYYVLVPIACSCLGPESEAANVLQSGLKGPPYFPNFMVVHCTRTTKISPEFFSALQKGAFHKQTFNSKKWASSLNIGALFRLHFCLFFRQSTSARYSPSPGAYTRQKCSGTESLPDPETRSSQLCGTTEV